MVTRQVMPMRAFSATGLRKAEHAEETFEEFTER
jgi:hypothetical protein